MRITKINIPKELINNGLEAVEMYKLGQVVLLAGKNGAGKTRLLNLISNVMSKKPKISNIKQYKAQINEYKNTIQRDKESIEKINHQLKSQAKFLKDEDKKTKEGQIIYIGERITKSEEYIINYENAIDWSLIETAEISEDYKIVPFVPKDLKIVDSNSFTKNNLFTHAQSIDQVGVDSLAAGTFARIQVVQDRWFNATHQDSQISEEEKKLAIQDYDRLKNLISVFLDVEIQRNVGGEPTLFGFTLGRSNLSDGQKVLLQLCLAIHCQNKSLDELILFMDEPENHLHPSIIIQTIKKIIEAIPNGQIWISTHSIPLLSHFDPSCIWFMEENKVSHAGSGPEKVLNSLLGDEDQRGKLQDFLNLPGIHALNRHAFESLFHPEPVMTSNTDPQTLQIRAEIKRHLREEKKIRILDFGAGKGRLLANIIESNKEPISNLIEWLDYIAYDKSDSDKVDCLAILGSIYPNPQDRYFNNFTDVFAKYDKETFDLVIMCNVLHEIDPKDWLSLFSATGDIPNSLSKDGILLLVEDQQMPIGEKAYQNGFIVLNTAELKELFLIKEQEPDFGFSDAKGNGRLKAHRIGRDYLTRITPDSRLKALESLNKNASEQILKVRGEEINYRNGKIHGFWVQQYANTGLALKELKGV